MPNQVAIVTGAAHPSGIGYAIASRLKADGHTVVTVDLEGADRDVDVTDKPQIERCIREIVQAHGRLDILVNNAGIAEGSDRFLEQTTDELDRTFAVNVKGMVQFSQGAIPHMQQKKAGVIVNIASLSGLRAMVGIPPAYTASKFAVVGLTKAMALEFGVDNIRVNAVCPGSVDTSMRAKALDLLAAAEAISRDDAAALENELIALGRPSTPAEIAAVVAFLCSEGCNYMTGAAIPVDGGMQGGF